MQSTLNVKIFVHPNTFKYFPCVFPPNIISVSENSEPKNPNKRERSSCAAISVLIFSDVLLNRVLTEKIMPKYLLLTRPSTWLSAKCLSKSNVSSK